MVPRGARNELGIQLTSALAETMECPAAGRSQPGESGTIPHVHVLLALQESTASNASSSPDGQAMGGVTATGRESTGRLLRPPGNKMFHSQLEENNPIDAFPLSSLLFLLALTESQTLQGEILFDYLFLFCLSPSTSANCVCMNPHPHPTQILIPQQLCLISHLLS